MRQGRGSEPVVMVTRPNGAQYRLLEFKPHYVELGIGYLLIRSKFTPGTPCLAFIVHDSDLITVISHSSMAGCGEVAHRFKYRCDGGHFGSRSSSLGLGLVE